MHNPLLSSGSGVRPFGVSLLVAGFDDKGPQLYQVLPAYLCGGLRAAVFFFPGGPYFVSDYQGCWFVLIV